MENKIIDENKQGEALIIASENPNGKKLFFRKLRLSNEFC